MEGHAGAFYCPHPSAPWGQGRTETIPSPKIYGARASHCPKANHPSIQERRGHSVTTPWVRAVWRGAWPSPAEQSPPPPGQVCGPWGCGSATCCYSGLFSSFWGWDQGLPGHGRTLPPPPLRNHVPHVIPLIDPIILSKN